MLLNSVGTRSPSAHSRAGTGSASIPRASFLRHIGDYVGHRSASSTQIYGKIAVERLREVALGDGEDVL